MRQLLRIATCMCLGLFLHEEIARACDTYPVAEITSPYAQTIPVGGTADFNAVGAEYPYYATGSHDPDDEDPYGAGNGIDSYWWSFGDDTHSSEGKPSHTYGAAGTWYVQVAVTDEESNTDYDSCWVNAVMVEEIRATCGGDWDENGALYVSVDSTVTIYADKYPESASWPTGTPTWTLNPPGSATLTPCYGSYGPAAVLDDLDEPGTYYVTAECGTSDETVVVVAVEVNEVTVDSGATQTGVTGAKNWVAVKDPGQYVIVEAVLDPNIPESKVGSWLAWMGGESVEGHPLQRKVSKSTSAKTTVTASAGLSSDYVDVWILWATGEIRTSGQRSSNNGVTFPVGYGGDNLGPRTDEDDGIDVAEALGKIEAVFTLSPSGIHQVAESGYSMHRWKAYVWCSNGTVYESDSGYEGTNPSDLDPNDGKLYNLDAPSCGYASVDHTAEVYDNFTQWVCWNGTKCSDDYYWYYRAWVDDDLDAANKPYNDDTELNDVGTGWIELPTSAHYSER